MIIDNLEYSWSDSWGNIVQVKGGCAMREMDRAGAHRGRRWGLRGGLLVAAVALLVAATGVGTAAAATLVSDDFEDGNAAGWVTTGGTDRDCREFRGCTSRASRQRWPDGQASWRDYTVRAEVRATSFNGMPGFVGVVARAQSTSNYYALVLRPNNTAALTRTVGGTSTTLASIPVGVSAGTSYTLTLRTSGQTLTGQVNGAGLSASDGFLNGGPAGLVTTWTTASFDNVTVIT
jgi:pectate lyase